MKKIVLSLAVAAGVMLVACEKKQIETSTTTSATNANATNSSQTGANERNDLRKWFDRGGSDYGCEGSDGNCGPDVIVTAYTERVINTIGTEASSGDTTGMINTIKSNIDSLIAVAPKQTWGDVVSGKTNLSVRGTVDSSSTAYLLFSQSGKIISVQPATSR